MSAVIILVGVIAGSIVLGGLTLGAVGWVLSSLRALCEANKAERDGRL